MSFLEPSSTGIWRILVPAVIIVEVALAGYAVLDHMTGDRRAAEHRALATRADELTARALVPGSALPCLDAAAGDTTETACETAVFGSPQSTAAAVAYIGARLSLLNDAKDKEAPPARFAATRRAIELDRFGIAAHVLSERDGCSAAQCSGFALVSDSSMLRSNLKARTFDQYVSRHSVAWNRTPAEPAAPAVSQNPPSAAAPAMAAVAPTPADGKPLSPKYDFPSAASIPAVSIMNTEPALPKEPPKEGAQAQAPAAERTPLPPRRPQERPPQATNEPADIAPAR